MAQHIIQKFRGHWIFQPILLLSIFHTAVSCNTADTRNSKDDDLADSLWGHWKDELYVAKDTESVRISAKKYYDRAKFENNEKLQINAGIYLGYIYSEGMPDSMLYYFNEILPLVKRSGSTQFIPLIYDKYATYAANTLLDYNVALYWYIQAVESAYGNGDMVNYCALLCNTSNIYYKKGDSDGLPYALEAYRIAHEIKNDYLIFHSALCAARMHNLSGEYRKSLEYLDEAGQYRQYDTDRYVEYLYATNYFSLGDTALAERYFHECFTKNTGHQDSPAIEAYLGFGSLLCRTGQYDEAQRYYAEGIRMSGQQNDKSLLEALYRGMSETYGLMGDSANCKKYSEAATAIKDTLSTVDKEREFGKLRLQYYEATNRIDMQKKDFELKNTRIIFIASTLVLLTLLMSVIFYYKKKRQGYKELVKRYEERRTTIEKLENEIKKLSINVPETAATDNGKGRNENLFSRLEDIMRQKQAWRDKDISKQSLAQMLGTNTLYVSKCLSDAGTSFYQYVNKYRINEAIKILSTPGDDTPMKAIAENIGYNSLSSFYRVFQKETGVPPKYYRETLKSSAAKASQ